MPKKKTHEEYVAEVAIKNPNIEVIGEYINAKTKILHMCRIHNIQWMAVPDIILRGCGCWKCKIDKDLEKSKKITKSHNQYVEELINKNLNIEAIEQYNGANVSILHKCKICKHEWNVRPNNVLHGFGCPKCAIKIKKENKTKTHLQYVLDLYEKNPNLDVIEQYNGNNNSIKHCCKKHNVEFDISPSNALRGHGCKYCHSEKITNALSKSHEQYVDDLVKKNIDIDVVGVYINANTSITHRCKKCECTWDTLPNNILRGSGCPQCNESRGEREINRYLSKNGIGFISQYRFNDCRDKNTLPFDFYLPKLNLCIEYDGEQHFKSIDFFGGEEGLKSRQLHDKIKTEYCKINNISLLRIRYDDDIEDKLNNFIHLI